MAEAELPIRNDSATPDAPERGGIAPVATKRLRLIAMISVPLLIVAGGATYWIMQQGKVSTDNAYVRQDKVSVSAEVGGRIVEAMECAIGRSLDQLNEGISWIPMKKKHHRYICFQV